VFQCHYNGQSVALKRPRVSGDDRKKINDVRFLFVLRCASQM
jgi:hypothetical protein